MLQLPVPAYVASMQSRPYTGVVISTVNGQTSCTVSTDVTAGSSSTTSTTSGSDVTGRGQTIALPLLSKLLDDAKDKNALDWMSLQQRFNDINVKIGRAVYPNLQINNGRCPTQWVRVVYSFQSGEIFVQLEDQAAFNHFMNFTELDWEAFVEVANLIKTMLKIFEKNSIFSIDQYLEMHPEKIQRDQFDGEKFLLVINSRLMAVVFSPKAHGIQNQGSRVEIRCYVPPTEEEVVLGLSYKFLPNRFAFQAGTFDYFSRCLISVVNQGIQAWRSTRDSCHPMWTELTQSFPAMKTF